MWPRSCVSCFFAISFAVSVVRCQILSPDSAPISYHLKIDASQLAASDTFNGTLSLNFTVSNSIPSLVLHSVNLTVNESSIEIMKKKMFSDEWEHQPIRNISVNETTLVISFQAPIATGGYSLTLGYQGHYQDRMVGFAKVGYHSMKTQKYLGVTSLEPTNARRVFPCYDVPGFRTKIRLEIIVNKTNLVVSNVNYTSIKNVTETARVFLFDNYPKMPLYQLGWAILDQASYMELIDNSTSTVIHTSAPYPYISHTAWANHLTAQLVVALENYTGVNYSHKKLEQIVLPEFFTGTSEGYGIISYSEESILVTPNQSSARYMQDVGLGLARGVIQQWYGDLLSVDSWDNMWMMKGINQYLQYIIASSQSEMSSWELQDQVAVELTQLALSLDSNNSHSLTVHGSNEPLLVNTVYDNLSKYKSGAIIRMLHNVLGSSFHKALATFIKYSIEENYNPSNPTKLWNMVYEVANNDKVDLAQQALSAIMEEWTSAPGYPVLTVENNGSSFIVSQSNTSKWWVPVSYSLQGSLNVKKIWLKPASSLTIPASASKWILVNINQTGFYRVNYSSSLWNNLSNQLKTDLTQLPRLNRAQLIDDVFSFDFVMALQFTGFLRAETDYFPWNTALRHYRGLIHSLYGHSSYNLLQNYVLDLMVGVIAQVGLSAKPQDTHLDKLKRSLVLERACEFGHKSCIQKAVSILKSWMAKTFYDPDLNPALLCAALANSSESDWRDVWGQYQYALIPSVRSAIIQALPCTKNITLLNEFLTNVTSTSAPVVSNKDKAVLFQTLSSTPFGAQALLNWLVDRLKAQANISSPEVREVKATSPSSLTNLTLKEVGSNDTTEMPSGESISGSNSSVIKTVMEKLPESEVVTIINLVLPRLNTLTIGTKLDSFLTLGSKTGLTNSTLEVMRNATRQIYKQADEAMKLNSKLAAWLEEAAAATTTGSTTGSTPTMPPHSTTKPSGSPSVYTSSILYTVLLIIFVNFIVTL